MKNTAAPPLESKPSGEPRLRAALEELRRANRELDEYAAFASHDLQEPLRKISIFATLLEDRYKGRLDKDAELYLHSIIDGAARLREMIIELLSYSKIGRAEPEPPARTDLNRVVRRALDDLKEQVQAARGTVELGGLPVLEAREGRIAQLFRHLISNALKFREPSRPAELSISAERRPSDWLLRVSDNGIGFEPRDAERIFAPFTKLHPRGRYPGTGIGLAVCRKIVESHGGAIWAESKPGRGSTFFFTLPNKSPGWKMASF